MQPRRIAVAYLCDANYHDITQYSLASVARSHASPVAFHILQSGYRGPVEPSLVRFVRSLGHSLEVGAAPSPEDDPQLGVRIGKHRHITGTALSKAAAIDVLTRDYDTILYLDGDTLAFGDLHCEAIADFPGIAAACLDLAIGTGLDDSSIFERCRAAGRSPYYFNSGVMMINAARWRETDAPARFAENFERHRERCPYMASCPTHDQCVFNMTFGWDTVRLPIALNVQKCAMHTVVWERALVRHYTGPRKFLPVRWRTCDRREFALLKAISLESGLPRPGAHDGGLCYRLNGLRRRGAVAISEGAILAAGRCYPQIVAPARPVEPAL